MNAAARRRRKRDQEHEIVTFRMLPGDPVSMVPDNTVISVVGYGTNAYLWVGNNHTHCFATLSGAGLRKLVGRFLASRVRKSR